MATELRGGGSTEWEEEAFFQTSGRVLMLDRW
jgi:hypothetical protein